MTVRSATDALVAEGLVVRRHGSGTYVQAPPVIRFLGLTSFTQDMRARGPRARQPAARLRDRASGRPDGRAAAGPDRRAGPSLLAAAHGSGEPMAIETVRIASALVPGLAPHDLDGSLYELLASRYQLGPGRPT